MERFLPIGTDVDGEVDSVALGIRLLIGAEGRSVSQIDESEVVAEVDAGCEDQLLKGGVEGVVGTIEIDVGRASTRPNPGEDPSAAFEKPVSAAIGEDPTQKAPEVLWRMRSCVDMDPSVANARRAASRMAASTAAALL